MDTLPLPPSPSLEQYKKRAKALVTAAESADPSAVRDWARKWLESLASSARRRHHAVRARQHRPRGRAHRGASARPARFEADFSWPTRSISSPRRTDIENWAGFAQHVEEAEGKRQPHDEFELAADAVVDGDLATLESLRSQESGADPRAISARPSRDAASLRGRERRRRFSSEDAKERGRDRAIPAGVRSRSGRARRDVRRRHTGKPR